MLRTRQAEEALRANEARLASIIRTATDAIVLADSQLRINLFNSAAERLFGWRAVDLAGGTLETIIPRFSTDTCAEFIQPDQLMARAAAGEYVQCNGRRRDGTEFPIEVSLGNFEQDGQQMLTITIRDITRRKQAEAKLSGAQRLASLAQTAGRDHAAELDEVRKP
jgi:two-component system sensor kinase FixL